MATSETTIRLLLSVGLLHCSQNAIDKLSVIKIIEMKNAINSHKNVKKKHTHKWEKKQAKRFNEWKKLQETSIQPDLLLSVIVAFLARKYLFPLFG